jgi:phage-related protein
MTICWHFPRDAWKDAGFEFDDVGAGTREIRVRDAGGIYRVMYVAKFEEAIYVLHCFEKKTQVTGKRDKVIAVARYRAVVDARRKTT